MKTDVKDTITNQLKRPITIIDSAYKGDWITNDFSKASYSYDMKTVTINNMAGMTGPTNDNSTFNTTHTLNGIASLINFDVAFDSSSPFKSITLKTNAMTINADGSTLTLPYVFTLKDNYILDSNISFITNDGVKFIFTLFRGKWVKN